MFGMYLRNIWRGLKRQESEPDQLENRTQCLAKKGFYLPTVLWPEQGLKPVPGSTGLDLHDSLGEIIDLVLLPQPRPIGSTAQVLEDFSGLKVSPVAELGTARYKVKADRFNGLPTCSSSWWPVSPCSTPWSQSLLIGGSPLISSCQTWTPAGDFIGRISFKQVIYDLPIKTGHLLSSSHPNSFDLNF
jgi:hypothetical protein